MIFEKKQNVLIAKHQNETIMVEAWGNNSLRIRATQFPAFSNDNKALDYVKSSSDITILDTKAVITNGALSCEIYKHGGMAFFKNGKHILREYYRDFRNMNEHSSSMKVAARNFIPQRGGSYSLTVCFEANKNEKIFGMGQYQQDNFDLKGTILELAQRNSQISIPFYMSSLGYGFLWNNPAIGEVMFGNNYTKWTAQASDELDYWICVGDTPKDIMKSYTDVTGRAPEFPKNALGLWQCKLRYRTQNEVLEVAREYKRRGIPLDVIVIDFFHWTRQGDWKFDPIYWQDPKGMVDELRAMGTRCMVSIWPTVDKKSENYAEMRDKGLLVRTERGSMQCFDFLGDTVIYDATNPQARKFIWDVSKKNYYDYGIDMFWLDEAEPEYTAYDFDNYRYYTGTVLKVGNSYPKCHAQAYYEGMREQGQQDIVNLLRCAWVGSQKYAALVWSGDIKSNFTALRDQVVAGLHMGIAGIPWWVSDTGGFFGNVEEDGFVELLLRWFQFSAFCPVLRMHGDRGPHDIPNLSDLDYGGGFAETGRPNELWSYGEEAYSIMKKYLDIRLGMKDYIKSIMDEASENGSPVIRTMFYEFPNDEKCWSLQEQYMFGFKYLVAPVMYKGMKERNVYLPQGKWKYIHDGKEYDGGCEITVQTPIDIIPVFEKIV